MQCRGRFLSFAEGGRKNCRYGAKSYEWLAALEDKQTPRKRKGGLFTDKRNMEPLTIVYSPGDCDYQGYFACSRLEVHDKLLKLSDLPQHEKAQLENIFISGQLGQVSIYNLDTTAPEGTTIPAEAALQVPKTDGLATALCCPTLAGFSGR